MVRMRSPVRIWPAAPRRSKLHIACSDFLCLWQKNRSALIPLLLLSNPNPLSLGFGFAFWGNEVEPGAFSSYRIAFRTGELTGEACFNKTRRPPEAVAASSNLASSSTSEQSPLCSGVFYFAGNRKHHPLRYLAPPLKPEPAMLGFGFVYLERIKSRALFQVTG